MKTAGIILFALGLILVINRLQRFATAGPEWKWSVAIGPAMAVIGGVLWWVG